MKLISLILIVTAALLTNACRTAEERKDVQRNMKKFGQALSLAEQEAIGLISTGLQPVYPIDAKCDEVVSFFADQTRYDGSLRVTSANNGRHGGIDISLPIGTPIMAIADGTVIKKARGGQMIGFMIMLQHTPEDTGLPVWTFSKYQHFNRMPYPEVGVRVKMGDVIGVSGQSGTTGGHYGDAGYPHLHMNVYMNDTGKFKTKDTSHKVGIKDKKYVDPLAVYHGSNLDSHELIALPVEKKRFSIPYTIETGVIEPKGTRFLWPVACKPLR
ncbi:MAG: M23 family metallopeptidase [Nitrospira sp.]|nr:M23 family metallopeptidase [Nitrospira sp.]